MPQITLVCHALVLWLTFTLAGSISFAMEDQAWGTGWQAVDKLVEEQKYQEALKSVENLVAAAVKDQNDRQWTKALIRAVQLKTGLHGYETAVRFLREQPWPKSALSRLTVQLFYTHSLIQYLDMYSWEIRQRERVEAKGPVDLKAWTADQIYTEALRNLDDAWKGREALSAEPLGKLADYLTPNTYPPGVRDTLRDLLSYMAVNLLANSAHWRPEESNELYRLNFSGLLTGKNSDGVALMDAAVHPIGRAMAVLSDLEAWHGGAKLQNPRAVRCSARSPFPRTSRCTCRVRSPRHR